MEYAILQREALPKQVSQVRGKSTLGIAASERIEQELLLVAMLAGHGRIVWQS
jgi:hypothetical protein